jgi:hypothetical protein
MIIPSVKKKENKDWLKANEETFLNYMATHHSMHDMAHTYLHYETFNDAYVEGMIANIEAAEKKRQKEEKILKAKVSGKKVSKVKEMTAVEKKMAEMEEKTVEGNKNVSQWEDMELPD